MAKQTNVRSSKKFPVTSVVIILVITGLAVFGGYYFYKYQDLSSQYSELSRTPEDKVKEIINEVSKLYNIPTYEEEKPTIPGTAIEGAYYLKSEEDLEKFRAINDFYKEANVDDVLLAYKGADISIIYRPSENRIIKTGSYSNGVFITVEIAILAGPKVAEDIANKLKSTYPNVDLDIKEGSAKVTKGVVVDITGNETEAAKQIAKLLGYEVGDLPAGEKAPEGAKLIIIGPTTD